MKFFNALLATSILLTIANPSEAASMEAKGYAQSMLDAGTRYASSDGYYSDKSRLISPYREAIYQNCFESDTTTDEQCIDAANKLGKVIKAYGYGHLVPKLYYPPK